MNKSIVISVHSLVVGFLALLISALSTVGLASAASFSGHEYSYSNYGPSFGYGLTDLPRVQLASVTSNLASNQTSGNVSATQAPPNQVYPVTACSAVPPLGTQPQNLGLSGGSGGGEISNNATSYVPPASGGSGGDSNNPGGNNSSTPAEDTTITNNTNVAVTSTNTQTASTGSANVSNNTTGGDAKSGDASNNNTNQITLSIKNGI